MKKKVLSLVLALLMTASAASTVLADEATAIAEEPVVVEEVAEEVEAGQYDKAIEFLANYGIFKGYNADDTGAEDLIQRYQMALFVGRIATGWVDDEQWEDGPENWSEFDDIDVDPVNKYYGALSFANQKGIIQGYGNGKFGPTASITYQDALTMVVRTLGYTGLDWPWGYIQKAVELGLTDGITGVAYTDELTRGEVAQIIYNALFATTKNGTNLAMSSFGIEFGWEKVVITASDLDIFVEDDVDAYKKIESNGAYTEWKESNRTADGYVAFKLLNDDGTLGDDTYYMLGSDIGLSGADHAHDDEAVVGDSYYILFEKDEDSNLAKVVAYESLYLDTLWNAGKTDDEGEEQAYEIKEFLNDYKFVSKYSDNAFVNVTASGKNEVIVYSALANITEEYIDGNYIAIDWETGDILEPVTDDDGEVVLDDDGKYKYQVAWYYNELLGNYYQYEEADGKYDDGIFDGILGINYMSEKEFEEFYKELNIIAKRDRNGYAVIENNPSTTAYASLDLYDTNLDGIADRGIYETYKLGYFAEDGDNFWCGYCGHHPAYTISNVSSWARAVESLEYRGVSYDASSVNVMVEGDAVCTHNTTGSWANRGWFVEGYTPVVSYDEEGEADGYEAGYVIYSYNAETGAIKVIKNVDDGSDEDSFVATGVLRAYNTKTGTVTIGDTTYSIVDYDELAGNAFYGVAYNSTSRGYYTDLFRSLFNQFVEYVVVDGELVAVYAKNASSSKAIVVDSYAGLSSDGYIVVNGYLTSELEYDQFRIGSYNGWQKGDYYYNLDKTKAEESFTKGTIYAIASYDAEEDVYYVNLAGEWTDDGYEVEEGVNLHDVKIESVENGTYMEYTLNPDEDNESVKSRKMSSSDKYVIILDDADALYAPVYVYEGKLPAGAVIEGDRINDSAYDNTTYVIVNATVTGMTLDSYKTGLVLLLEDKYLVADYNGANAEDWYLLGASVYEVEVFDLMLGKVDAVYAGTNIDLDVGNVYFTQDGVIVEDNGVVNVDHFYSILDTAYPTGNTFSEDYDIDSASYLYGKFDVTEENYKSLFEKDELAAIAHDEDGNLIAGSTDVNEAYGHSTYRDTIDDIYVYALEQDEDDAAEIKGVTSLSKASKVEDYMEDYDEYDVRAIWIYDLATDNIVVYLYIDETSDLYNTEDGTVDTECITGLTEDEDDDAAIVLENVDTGVEIVAKEVGYTAEYNNGDINRVAVTSVTISFAGDFIDGTEANDYEDACADHRAETFTYSFGDSGKVTYKYGTCKEGANAYALVDGVEVALKSVTETTYDDVCKLIKGFVVEFEDVEYIDGTATVEIVIPAGNGGEFIYSFDVTELVEVEVDGEDVENVVLVNYDGCDETNEH